MINTKSITVLSAATVLAISLTGQNSLADTTNGSTAGTIDFQFQNAPALRLIEWVTQLSAKPVVIPYDLNFLVTYKTEQKVTVEEALHDIDGVLQANGYHLMKPDESYYRVVKIAETNLVSNHSHIDLAIQGDKIVVNGNTIVDRKDLAKTLATLSKPDEEIWIYHPVTEFTNNEIVDLAINSLVSTSGLDASKVFLKFMPRGK
jgi:hypothetical protein